MHYRKKRGFRGGRGGRRIKTFDPRELIKNTNTPEKESPLIGAQEEITMSFSDFDIRDELKHSVKSRGFETPTRIQVETIPEILQGRDVVGISNTGTGKTGAFLIPLIDKALINKSSRVLIVAPTRELALQIDEEFRQFRNNLKLYSAVCIGGVKIQKQIRVLKHKPRFVIATPGRLLDLSNQRKISLQTFDSVVLDEVDRMLDMGFIHDVKKIVKQLPKERQSLFFSATLDAKTKSVMQDFLRNPKIIRIQETKTNLDITQEVVVLDGVDRDTVLQNILDEKEVEKTLVFLRTKRRVDKVSKLLNRNGFRTSVMHGNKSQSQRQRSLKELREGRIEALISTDVAARGIDIDDITHVINYDLPETEEDYIHRIGRTGRKGKKGTAISFID